VIDDPYGFGPALRSAADRRRKPRDAQVYDQPLFLQTLSRFAMVLPARYELETVLCELSESVTAVLGLSGSGVTIAEDCRGCFVTAVNEVSEELQRIQEEQQAGPCRDTYDTGEVVRVSDVRLESARWPELTLAATGLSIAGIAGVPMRLDDQIIGALNLYSAEPREWSDEDIAVAEVLAEVATSYVVNASKLRQQEQLSEQLRQALESRIIIEQAKGITAERHAISVDPAYQLMRGHARNNNASLRGVAEAIVAVGLQV
jgi:GAF domain-containing protein